MCLAMKCERVQKAINGFIVWRRRHSPLGMSLLGEGEAEGTEK